MSPRGDRGNWGGARPGPHPGRPRTEETIEQRFGVAPPLGALFAELERRHGADAAAELRAIYDAAAQRYARAARLLTFERELRRGSRLMSPARQAARRAVLARPQDYIAGAISLETVLQDDE